MNYTDDTDKMFERLCIFREARGASLPCKAAVLAVIRNRIADPRWPNSAVGVILQPLQFSSFNHSDPNSTLLPNPKNGLDWAAWLDCCAVVDVPLISDPTFGATHYHTIPDSGLSYTDTSGKVVKLLPPDWAAPSKLTLTIGQFHFFKL